MPSFFLPIRDSSGFSDNQNKRPEFEQEGSYISSVFPDFSLSMLNGILTYIIFDFLIFQYFYY
jgi:hypothetical protein